MPRLIALLTALSTFLATEQPPPPTRTTVAAPPELWYAAPAAAWNEALPIGNGRLGAMVFGGVADERLQLNEDSVWAGL